MTSNWGMKRSLCITVGSTPWVHLRFQQMIQGLSHQCSTRVTKRTKANLKRFTGRLFRRRDLVGLVISPSLKPTRPMIHETDSMKNAQKSLDFYCRLSRALFKFVVGPLVVITVLCLWLWATYPVALASEAGIIGIYSILISSTTTAIMLDKVTVVDPKSLQVLTHPSVLDSQSSTSKNQGQSVVFIFFVKYMGVS